MPALPGPKRGAVPAEPRARRGRLPFRSQRRIVATVTSSYGEITMAKGQLRSNKEKKKPKQSGKPGGPATPAGSTKSKPVPPAK
jgi:hypothetical protein